MFGCQVAQVCEDLLLEAHYLGHRLDDEVGLPNGESQIGVTIQASQRRLHLFLAYLAARDPLLQVGLYLREASVKGLLIQIEQRSVVASRSRHMGDAVPHGSRSQNCNKLDFSVHPRAPAMQRLVLRGATI